MTIVQYLSANGISGADLMKLAKEDRDAFLKLKDFAREEMKLLGVEITEAK